MILFTDYRVKLEEKETKYCNILSQSQSKRNDLMEFAINSSKRISRLEKKLNSFRGSLEGEKKKLVESKASYRILKKDVDEGSGLFNDLARLFSKERAERSNKLKKELSDCEMNIQQIESVEQYYQNLIRDYLQQIEISDTINKEYNKQIDKKIDEEKVRIAKFCRKYEDKLKRERQFSQFIHTKVQRQMLALEKATGNLQLQVIVQSIHLY
jgi:hypothetical protein